MPLQYPSAPSQTAAPPAKVDSLSLEEISRRVSQALSEGQSLNAVREEIKKTLPRSRWPEVIAQWRKNPALPLRLPPGKIILAPAKDSLEQWIIGPRNPANLTVDHLIVLLYSLNDPSDNAPQNIWIPSQNPVNLTIETIVETPRILGLRKYLGPHTIITGTDGSQITFTGVDYRELAPDKRNHVIQIFTFLIQLNRLIKESDEPVVTSVEFTDISVTQSSGNARSWWSHLVIPWQDPHLFHIIAHEFGHSAYQKLLGVSSIKKEASAREAEWDILCETGRKSFLTEMVDDSNYVFGPAQVKGRSFFIFGSRKWEWDAMGHPNNPTELFASCFATYVMHFRAFEKNLSDADTSPSLKTFGSAIKRFFEEHVLAPEWIPQLQTEEIFRIY